MAQTFESLLPRLVASYERGRLVPFIGSGLSLPVCPSWTTFIERLEQGAGISGVAAGATTESERLIRRANVAARTLRLRDPQKFGELVAGTLGDGKATPPAQTVALARTWWPLVLTTNYDNCYVSAFRIQHGRGAEQRDARRVRVLGRSVPDCQHVLASLSSPSDAVVWALQGFVSAPVRARRGVRDPDLAEQLVIGHQEYREVTNREPHFRRAFAELFRSRSLFFVGSGLSEPYLLDLFGEVLEMYGPATRPNYALVKRGLLDPGFMLARFQTIVVEYDDHREVPRMLNRLADAIEERSCRVARWSFAIDVRDVVGNERGNGDLIVVRAELEAPRAKHECLAVSGSGSKPYTVYYSAQVTKLLKQELGIASISRVPPREEGSPSVWTHRLGHHPVYVVRARDDHGRRDLRNVFPACSELFDRAWADGFRRVRMQLPSAGKDAAFPAYHSFAQVVRAFGWWRKCHPRRLLSLVLYVWKPSVYRELSSGRLDAVELLADIDLRFWVDVNDGRRFERRLCYEQPDLTLAALCARLQLPSDGWTVEVEPAPQRDAVPQSVAGAAHFTLIDLGIVTGSTLRFRYRPH